MYYPNILKQMFFFGYELDQDGEPIVDPNNFHLLFTSKKAFELLQFK